MTVLCGRSVFDSNLVNVAVMFTILQNLTTSEHQYGGILHNPVVAELCFHEGGNI